MNNEKEASLSFRYNLINLKDEKIRSEIKFIFG